MSLHSTLIRRRVLPRVPTLVSEAWINQRVANGVAELQRRSELNESDLRKSQQESADVRGELHLDRDREEAIEKTEQANKRLKIDQEAKKQHAIENALNLLRPPVLAPAVAAAAAAAAVPVPAAVGVPAVAVVAPAPAAAPHVVVAPINIQAIVQAIDDLKVINTAGFATLGPLVPSIQALSAANTVAIQALSATNTLDLQTLNNSIALLTNTTSTELKQLSHNQLQALQQLAVGNTTDLKALTSAVNALTVANSADLKQLSTSQTQALQQLATGNTFDMKALIGAISMISTPSSASINPSISINPSQLSSQQLQAVQQLSSGNSNDIQALTAAIALLTSTNSSDLKQLSAAQVQALQQIATTSTSDLAALNAANAIAAQALLAATANELKQISLVQVQAAQHLAANNTSDLGNLASAVTKELNVLSSANTTALQALLNTNSTDIKALTHANSLALQALNATTGNELKDVNRTMAGISQQLAISSKVQQNAMGELSNRLSEVSRETNDLAVVMADIHNDHRLTTIESSIVNMANLLSEIWGLSQAVPTSTGNTPQKKRPDPNPQGTSGTISQNIINPPDYSSTGAAGASRQIGLQPIPLGFTTPGGLAFPPIIDSKSLPLQSLSRRGSSTFDALGQVTTLTSSAVANVHRRMSQPDLSMPFIPPFDPNSVPTMSQKTPPFEFDLATSTAPSKTIESQRRSVRQAAALEAKKTGTVRRLETDDEFEARVLQLTEAALALHNKNSVKEDRIKFERGEYYWAKFPDSTIDRHRKVKPKKLKELGLTGFSKQHIQGPPTDSLSGTGLRGGSLSLSSNDIPISHSQVLSKLSQWLERTNGENTPSLNTSATIGQANNIAVETTNNCRKQYLQLEIDVNLLRRAVSTCLYNISRVSTVHPSNIANVQNLELQFNNKNVELHVRECSAYVVSLVHMHIKAYELNSRKSKDMSIISADKEASRITTTTLQWLDRNKDTLKRLNKHISDYMSKHDEAKEYFATIYNTPMLKSDMVDMSRRKRSRPGYTPETAKKYSDKIMSIEESLKTVMGAIYRFLEEHITYMKTILKLSNDTIYNLYRS